MKLFLSIFGIIVESVTMSPAHINEDDYKHIKDLRLKYFMIEAKDAIKKEDKTKLQKFQLEIQKKIFISDLFASWYINKNAVSLEDQKERIRTYYREVQRRVIEQHKKYFVDSFVGETLNENQIKLIDEVFTIPDAGAISLSYSSPSISAGTTKDDKKWKYYFKLIAMIGSILTMITAIVLYFFRNNM